MKFFYLGKPTSTSINQAFPLGDGSPEGVGAATLTLATSAALPTVYAGLAILVTASSGAGQLREILSNTTAVPSVVTVRPWDAPRPTTGSSYIFGVPLRRYDASAVKGESDGTATTGVWRLELWTKEDEPRLARSQPFVLGLVTTATSGMSSTGLAHLETRVTDMLYDPYAIFKVFVGTAPTANTFLFATPLRVRDHG